MLMTAVPCNGDSCSTAAILVGMGRAIGGRVGRCWGASAVGLAYLAGHAGVAGLVFPAAEFTDEIPWIAVLAVILAVTDAVRDFGTIARFVGRSILVALAVLLMIAPILRGGTPEREMAAKLALSASVATAAWVNLELLATRREGTDVFETPCSSPREARALRSWALVASCWECSAPR